MLHFLGRKKIALCYYFGIDVNEHSFFFFSPTSLDLLGHSFHIHRLFTHAIQSDLWGRLFVCDVDVVVVVVVTAFWYCSFYRWCYITYDSVAFVYYIFTLWITSRCFNLCSYICIFQCLCLCSMITLQIDFEMYSPIHFIYDYFNI